ncbi:hypothetical protein PYW07_015227 [Mythimna separata]|uniref:Serpin domain-containing protein n=1 Tax=Mythimna separata TaxID=271217 RepID=A0AAD7Z0G7_MYTSE|nr:hypothetical protein PYW07_015227 [Mythimna separata]
MKLFICILALAATAMSQQTNTDLLRSSNEVFTANMFQEVVKANPGENIVLSAFSVLTPLAQLTLASEGASHDEILKAIGLPNDNVTKEVFSDVSKQLRSVQGVELSVANKVYIRKDAVLNNDFAALSKEVFNSDLQNIDFLKKDEAAKEINAWVEENTNNKIKDLVKADSFDEDTAAVLVNAIYFKGKWKKLFPKEATEDKDFFVSKDVKVKKPTMHVTDNFKYGESQELNAKLLEIPYEGDQSSLLIVLPNEVDGISSLVEKLKEPAALTKAVDDMRYNEVVVDLPKFKIETTTNLKSVLEKLNILKLFQPFEAKLSKLIQGESNLYVSDAIQKAFIDVNEEGTEAAAANAFGITYLSAVIYEIRVFKADHPFAFYLMERDKALFCGIFQS